jgi:proliferating cell nuclear antigen
LLLVGRHEDFHPTDGIKLIALDPGRVGMVHLVINELESWYCKQPIVAGIYMKFLNQMVRNTDSGDLMEWVIYEDSPHFMHIILSNADKKTRVVKSLKLLDLDIEEISIPSVEFDRVVSMPSSDLSSHIRDLSNICNIISIRGTANTLEFSAKGK